MAALDREKYEVIPIAITPQGRWLSASDSIQLLPADGQGSLSTAEVSVTPEKASGVDVLFPVLHGTYGEDGTVQGLLELADVAYVGSGVLGSACGMDKDVMKRLFVERGLPTVEHVAILRNQIGDRWSEPVERFGYPLFVKPANLGSSVGVSKASNEAELNAALDEAARYDRKLIVERAVVGREIECAVLGNDEPKASVAGEVIPTDGFYDYEAKYLNDSAGLEIPAKLTADQLARVKRLAVAAFQAVECSGLARVDFFLEESTGRFVLNELNSMPGFTSISMYPKLWDASGVSYSELLDRLIELALERHQERRNTSFVR